MNRHILRSLGVIPSLLLLPSLRATSYTWTGNAGDNNWATSSNWSPAGPPNANATVLLNLSSLGPAFPGIVYYNYSGGTNYVLSQLTITHVASRFGGVGVLSIGANYLNAANETIGDSTLGGPLAGEVDQFGASSAYAGNLTLGRNPSDFGYYNLSGNATLEVVDFDNIGLSGHASFSQSGGLHFIHFSAPDGYNAGLFLAVSASASASYTFSGGEIHAGMPEYIGYGGNATFTQSGGTNNLEVVSNSTPNFYVGYLGGSNGTYTLTGNGALNLSLPAYIGYNGNGTFNQDAGAINPFGYYANITLGYNANASGTCNISGTAQFNAAYLTVGQSGNASFNQSGGSVYCNDCSVAAGAGSHASYSLSEGTLFGAVAVGDHGNGTFTQSGGAVVAPGFDLGFYSDGVGLYALSNGTLSVSGSEEIGFTGHATFNQTGGFNFITGNAFLRMLANGTYNLSGGSLTVPTIYVGGLFSRTGGSLAPTNIDLTLGGKVFLHNVDTKLKSLTFGGATDNWIGKMDITNTKLVIQPASSKSAALATLTNQALYGRTHAAGIYDSALPPNMVVAVIDNASLPVPLTTFGAIAVDPNSILISQELLGDANIDGKVDLTDLSTILNHFGQTTSNWTDGNFDGAPAIDLSDLSDLLNNFGASNPSAHTSPAGLASPSLSPTPEPTTLALLLPATLLLHARRSILQAGKKIPTKKRFE
ncbi:MAG: hypothetical protein ACTHN5_04970 [Phycisphaerae bacterium]